MEVEKQLLQCCQNGNVKQLRKLYQYHVEHIDLSLNEYVYFAEACYHEQLSVIHWFAELFPQLNFVYRDNFCMHLFYTLAERGAITVLDCCTTLSPNLLRTSSYVERVMSGLVRNPLLNSYLYRFEFDARCGRWHRPSTTT